MNLILVNELDEEIGISEKLYIHEKGILHRAFSIFLYNEKKEILLQKRSHLKIIVRFYGLIAAVVIQ